MRLKYGDFLWETEIPNDLTVYSGAEYLVTLNFTITRIEPNELNKMT